MKFLLLIPLLACFILVHSGHEYGRRWNKKYSNKNLSGYQFCGVYKCPKYEVICNKNKYEVRRYGPITWAFSKASGATKVEAVTKAFFALSNYTEEANLVMNAPALVKNPIDDGSYTVYYLTDSSNPQPSDPNVEIETWKPKYYFAYRYPGGVPKLYDTDGEFNQLRALLKKDGVSVDSDSDYYVAGYNAPQDTDRRNEIWIEADSDDVKRACYFRKASNRFAL